MDRYYRSPANCSSPHGPDQSRRRLDWWIGFREPRPAGVGHPRPAMQQGYQEMIAWHRYEADTTDQALLLGGPGLESQVLLLLSRIRHASSVTWRHVLQDQLNWLLYFAKESNGHDRTHNPSARGDRHSDLLPADGGTN